LKGCALFHAEDVASEQRRPFPIVRATLLIVVLLGLPGCSIATVSVPGQGLQPDPTETAVGEVRQESIESTCSPSPTATSPPIPEPRIPACGEQQAMLEGEFIDRELYYSIVPLGNVWPPAHVFPTDHIYFSLLKSDPDNWDSAPVDVPVYAPADIFMVSLASQEHLYADPPYVDFDIEFVICSEVRFRLGHMTTLSPVLLEALENPDSCEEYIAGERLRRGCWLDLSDQDAIFIEQGQLLGTTGGRLGQNMLDLWATDMRMEPLPFANVDRYWDEYLQTACPLDYFVEPLSSELRNLFGGHTGEVQRSIEPTCGQILYDMPGTAQGNWFFNAPSSPEDPHLSLVYDNVDPNRGVFSIGNAFGDLLPSMKYLFEPADEGTVNRFFSSVTPDGLVYCYEDLSTPIDGLQQNLTILLSMEDENTLLVEARPAGSCGAGPWDISDAALIFNR